MKESRNKLSEVIDAVARDPDFLLRVSRSRLTVTGNPYYCWKAIDVCATHKREFPDWLMAYLTQCAARMESDKARAARDLHKVLPWVFGFSTKRGPGNLLDPDYDPGDRDNFALKFAILLEQGEPPDQAMHKAYNKVFSEKDANADDRTLRRWLLAAYGVEKWPTNATDWLSITRKYYLSFFAAIIHYYEKAHPDQEIEVRVAQPKFPDTLA
jgi:hypothetical protein